MFIDLRCNRNTGLIRYCNCYSTLNSINGIVACEAVKLRQMGVLLRPVAVAYPLVRLINFFIHRDFFILNFR